MSKPTLSEAQKTSLHAINGTKNTHYDLARYCESKGWNVQGDQDDMELSHICVPDHDGDFWSSVVGTIRGDSEAVIAINPDCLD